LGYKEVVSAVRVIRKDDKDRIHDIGQLENMPCFLQGSTDAPANQTIAQPSLEIKSSLVEPQIQQITEVAWVGDDVEYVGLNDLQCYANKNHHFCFYTKPYDKKVQMQLPKFCHIVLLLTEFEFLSPFSMSRRLLQQNPSTPSRAINHCANT